MAWLLWLGGAIVLAIVELVTMDFFFLMLAGGALAGMIASMIPVATWLQVVAFAATSTLLLLVARPAARRWLESRSPNLRTNAKALVGRPAEVVAPITAAGGRVKIGGEVWTARSVNPQLTFEEGQTVLVFGIDGAYAIVGALEQGGPLPPQR